MDNPMKLATMDTQNTERRQTKQKTQHRKVRSWEKNRGWTQVCAKGKRLLPLIRLPPCYSYSQYVFWHHYVQANTNSPASIIIWRQTTNKQKSNQSFKI